MSLQPKKLLDAIAFGWTLIVLLLMAYSDFAMSALLENSDFLSCIYTGAKLFATGRQSEMYASLNATGFAHQPCDIAAHAYLPGFNPNLVAEFNYSPVVAWLLAPLSYLPPFAAMFAWQLISLAAVGGAVAFLVPKERRWAALRTSMLFLPLPIALWIGQLDLLFGVFFFAWGYSLIVKEKPLWAGFLFAIACLKPQFVVVPGLITLVFLANKEWKFGAGFAAGLFGIMASNLLVSSPELFQQWLANVKLCEKVFTATNNGIAEHLLVSLPGLTFRFLPPDRVTWIKPVIYACGVTLGLFTAWVCVRFRRTHTETKQWLLFTYISGLLLMPFVIPAMLFYDLSLYLTAGFACMDRQAVAGLQLPVRKILIAGSIVINLYGIILLTAKALAYPVLIVLALVILYLVWILPNANCRRTNTMEPE